MSKEQQLNGNEQPLSEFTKAQLLRSRQFLLVSKDVLAVLLQDNKRYTLPEVKRLMDAWLRKEANQ